MLLGCDVIHNFQSDAMVLNITLDPKEIIHIEGSNSASPTLNNIIISNSNRNEKGKLLFLLSSDIPQSETIRIIHSMSIDSLSEKVSFSIDDHGNPYYVLGLIDLNKKDSVHHKLDRPIVLPDNYVFTIPSIPEMDVKISLGFQRMGDNRKPKTRKIQI